MCREGNQETQRPEDFYTLKNLTIAFTGGGTAGHVLPNIALIETGKTSLGRLISDGSVKVCYIGSPDGIERQIVKNSKIDIQYIPVSAGKLRRYFSWQNFLSPFQVIKGFIEARTGMKKANVKALFSKGGFVSAPVVWAAWTLGIPVVIHESDFSPALATKLTQPFASAIFTAFEETIAQMSESSRKKSRAVGIPLRDELFDIKREGAIGHFKLNNNLPTLLVFGGSLGALALNKAIKPLLPELDKLANIIHLTGKGKTFETEGLNNYHQFEYLENDMSLALSAADCAFCRAGASSIFELAALRIPMLLLPLGLRQSRGDQIENARYFSSRNWARRIDEETMTSESLHTEIRSMIEERGTRRESLLNAPAESALTTIADCLLSLLQQ
jgi:UDP-N-acetylglucosamine--N-acetylmuramyl-(pentapeptide) pyrophosphoryl-undecaprenol N-acetylglucosamine transferase